MLKVGDGDLPPSIRPRVLDPSVMSSQREKPGPIKQKRDKNRAKSTSNINWWRVMKERNFPRLRLRGCCSFAICRREKIDQLRSLRPRLKVLLFLNMKLFADRSERVLVRKLVAPDVGWDELYSSSDQHSNPPHQDEFLGYSSTVSYRMLIV